MFWKTGYCFTAKEMFDTFNCTALKISRETVTKKYGCNSKQAFCGKVLLYCFYLILLDIIQKNVTFVLPTRGVESCLQVKQFSGDKFQTMYRGGKFAGIDFLSSGFMGYQIYFRYKAREGFREKPVYISNNMKDMFYENINNGKAYY